MPVYNGETYLSQAIESVLTQTFTDFEFLIINDGSTDRSVEIIESHDDPRIRLVHNETNLKLIATLNKGLELAMGKYIARMDADDMMWPQRLEKQTQYLDVNPHICVVGSWWETMSEDGKFLSYTRVPVSDYECAFMIFGKGENPVGHPCVIYRTEIIRQIGYKLEYRDAEDVDLWFRVISHGFRLANVPEILMSYRKHQHQVSLSSKFSQEKSHHLALSRFLSTQLNTPIRPQKAALIRPTNFNDKHFSDLYKIDEMFKLKERALGVFFKQYRLSVFKILRCAVTLWKSLMPLRKLKILSQLRMLYMNTRFCITLLQSQIKQQIKVIF